MKKILLALACTMATVAVFSQNPATMVISSTATKPVTIVENGGLSTLPIYIDISNPNPSGSAHPGIIVDGPQGFIVSENEFNMVKWDAQTAGIDTIPFGYVNGTTFYYLPLTVDIGTAGTGSGSQAVLYSTWHTIADQALGAPSTTGDPSDVGTNMGSFWGGGLPSNTDNSYNVVDRFWIMDPSHTGFAYTTAPAFAGNGVTFSYISSTGSPSEVLTPNMFAEPNLVAQRFHDGVGWGDWIGMGATDIGGANVGTAYSGPVPTTDFFRSWTLSNSINPLPITLSTFTAQCNNGTAALQWTVETQLNNSYFTVKKTVDGEHFETVGTVNGAGTTSELRTYNLTDNSPYPGTSYYFLYQTDYDGTVTQAGTDLFNGCGASENVTTVNGYNTSNCIMVDINSVAADEMNISLVNMLGQSVINETHGVAEGSNEIRLNNNFSPGIYILSVRDNGNVNYARKLVLGVR
jgi:Secretion system C-terminal sorting domain